MNICRYLAPIVIFKNRGISYTIPCFIVQPFPIGSREKPFYILQLKPSACSMNKNDPFTLKYLFMDPLREKNKTEKFQRNRRFLLSIS